ncbi:AraC family transcriptional regulator [Paenibacillus doosanensis]|uniref:AraC family transcriptional regulator n=1 Tax=Paenibacillus doosanensis TaxID=1229154 RepID=UPI0021806A70|nr:AraC family transcriptional regulator [Paenibacillus doosanensis]
MNKERRLKMESLLMIRFILPLLIVLTMSLMVVVWLYIRTADLLGEEVETSNRLLLEQGMNVLDKRWEAIDTFIRRVTEDPKVVRLQQIAEPFSSSNLYRTIEARNKLQDYYSPNELIAGYYILFKNNGLVLNNDYTARLEDFAEYVRYPERPQHYLQSLVQSYHYRDMTPAEPVIRQDGETLLTYMRSFGYANRPNGTVLVLIHNSEITKLFNGFRTDRGWAYIADEKGKLLTSVVGPGAQLPEQRLPLPAGSGVMNRTVGQDDMVVTYATSSYNGWSYVAAQPAKIALKKITYMKEMTTTVFLLFMLLSCLIGVYMAYRSSKPVRSILQTLASGSVGLTAPKRQGAFGMIHQSVALLLASQRELQDSMERQLPFLRTAFFERLLRGQFQSEADMEAVREHARIAWVGSSCLVALVTFPKRAAVYRTADIEALNRNKRLARELAHESDADNLFTHDVDDDKLALLMQFDMEDAGLIHQQANRLLEQLQLRLRQECGIMAVISAGNAYASRMDIARSFSEAQQALARSTDGRIVWFRELPPNTGSCYYPESMETRLINLVRTGRTEQLQSLLEELYQHNFVQRSLPVYMLKVFYFDLLASSFKIFPEIGESPAGQQAAEELNEPADNAESIEAHFLQLKVKLESMCEAAARQRADHQQQWFLDILEQVKSGYSDPQLSLALLADRYDVTEAHLSRLFKERIGINFIEFTENLRIEHSKRLLLQTGLPVREIAVSVGYSSSSTFGRAFKRSVGISAMAFRNSEKWEADKN